MTTKRTILSLLGIFSLAVVQAQVGVNTQSPKGTLHVQPMNTDGTTAEGIIAPNLSRAQLIAKDARYGTDQRGAIVYVSVVDGTVNTKTANITQTGYYYFDGSIWKPFAAATVIVPTEPWLVQGGTTQATGNAENIYQTGSVAVGSNSAGTYKFQVTGTSNITGNSRVGSSSVLGAEVVGGNLTVSGTAFLNNALNYKPGGTAPTANTYLRTDANGNATWQALPVTATTEPWRVQGGTTNATTNAQNIYQTGKVAIGEAQTTAARAEALFVSGATFLNGNTTIGTAGATYTNSYALIVRGSGTLGGLWVENYTNLKDRVTIGQNLTNADEGFSVDKGISRFAGPTFIAGTLNYKPGGAAPTANTYLRTDANGNATWQALPTTATTEPWRVQGGTNMATTNTQNIYQKAKVAIGGGDAAVSAYNLDVTGTSNVSGNSRVGSSSVLGAQVVSGNQTVNGNAFFTGGLNYKPGGTAPTANTYLRTDANGNATWQALPTTATTEPWRVQGGTNMATTNTQNIYQKAKVAIGGGDAAVSTYNLDVTGTSNVSGNSRVGSSTVVGAQTVGGNQAVAGNQTVAGTHVVTGNTGIGTSTFSQKFNVAGNTYISGSLALGIATPAQKLHVVGNQYTTGISKLGGNTTYNTSAQLELSDNNKGFLPNRVALTKASTKAPVTNAVDGMIVYNTATVAAEGLSPGLYYWRANSWQRLVDKLPAISVNLLNLTSDITITANGTDMPKGQKLPFNEITIPEDGSYAFSYRLYGRIAAGAHNSAQRMAYYIGIVQNNTTTKDAAEMDVIVIGESDYSYSVTLGGDFKKGDKVTTWMSKYVETANWWLKSKTNITNPVRTSMLWWKL